MNLIDRYFEAFSAKDIEAVAVCLHEDVSLQDQFVGLVQGRTKVLQVYREIFAANAKLDLKILRRYTEQAEFHAVQFELLAIDHSDKFTRIAGVDCIELCGDKIIGLRAYLHIE